MSERLRDVLAAHEGAFCICGELTTDPDAHVEAAVLAWLDELLGGDEAREAVAEDLRNVGHEPPRPSCAEVAFMDVTHAATAALAVVQRIIHDDHQEDQ